MAARKFKIRLGSQQYMMLSGVRYAEEHQRDTYNCRLSLRCGSLQVSGRGDFAGSELQAFVNDVVEVVTCLRGRCALVPTKPGTFSVSVDVGSTGKIVTRVEICTLTSDALDANGWNAVAQFPTEWNEYYNPIDVECLSVARVVGLPGHIPRRDGPGQH